MCVCPLTDITEDKSIPCLLRGENECVITFLMVTDEQGKTTIHNIKQKGDLQSYTLLPEQVLTEFSGAYF